MPDLVHDQPAELLGDQTCPRETQLPAGLEANDGALRDGDATRPSEAVDSAERLDRRLDAAGAACDVAVGPELHGQGGRAVKGDGRVGCCSAGREHDDAAERKEEGSHERTGA